MGVAEIMEADTLDPGHRTGPVKLREIVGRSSRGRSKDRGQVTVGTGHYATAFTVLLLAPVLMIACSSSAGEKGSTSGSVVSTEPAFRTGRGIFTATCAACHGAAAQGQPDWHIPRDDGTLPAPPLNGDGHTWHHADGLLYRIVSQGGKVQEDPSLPSFKSAMPALGDQLSHEEIIEVLTYVKGLWGDKTSRGLSIRESQALASGRDPFPPG